MMSGLCTLLTLVSVIYFPWPFTVLLALIAATMEPFVPLTAGLFADTLYYTPTLHTFPHFTLYGALATALVFFVRSRLRTSSM